MARRRMFSLDVIDTDKFLDMPSSTQALYFHLGMRADDDGFVASPKRTTAMCGCSNDDLNLLAVKGFVQPFESGVLVIVDWKLNNLIKSDRYKPSRYTNEKTLLDTDMDGRYIVGTKTEPSWSQKADTAEPQDRLGKDRIGKARIEGENRADKPPRPRFSPPSEDEAITFFGEQGASTLEAEKFCDYYTANGWRTGKNAMKDWKAAARNWIRHIADYGASTTKTVVQESAADTISRVAEQLNNGDYTLLGGGSI